MGLHTAQEPEDKIIETSKQKHREGGKKRTFKLTLTVPCGIASSIYYTYNESQRKRKGKE